MSEGLNPTISAILQNALKNPNPTNQPKKKQPQQQIKLDVPTTFQRLQQCQYNSFLVHLKDQHSQMQNQIVVDLKKMSQQSKKTIQQIDAIQKDIQKYQKDIDTCIKKIYQMESFVSKFQGVKNNFKIKANNIEKLRDALNSQKKKRR